MIIASTFVILLATLGGLSGSTQQLPIYTPDRLQPIAWPPDSPGPEFHAADRTVVVLSIASRHIAILRTSRAWGTGLIDEWYFVGTVSPEVSMDSLLYGTASVDSLWSARSFYNESSDGDSVTYHFTVAGCLFVADDSLLAYGVIADTNRYARDFRVRE